MLTGLVNWGVSRKLRVILGCSIQNVNCGYWVKVPSVVMNLIVFQTAFRLGRSLSACVPYCIFVYDCLSSGGMRLCVVSWFLLSVCVVILFNEFFCFFWCLCSFCGSVCLLFFLCSHFFFEFRGFFFGLSVFGLILAFWLWSLDF